MESLPAASLVVIQAAFLFGIFVKLLDDPASVGQQNKALQGGLRPQHAEPILDFLFLLLLRLNGRTLRIIPRIFWQRAFPQHPPLPPPSPPPIPRSCQHPTPSPTPPPLPP